MAAKTDPQKLAAFLELLALGHTVQHAAAEAGVGRSTVYERRESDEAFAAAWAEADEAGVQVLEQEARRRAVEGVPRQKYDKDGDLLCVEQVYSDTLLIFLLKARRPGVYRDHFRHEHVGADGKDITVRLAFDPSSE